MLRKFITRKSAFGTILVACLFLASLTITYCSDSRINSSSEPTEYSQFRLMLNLDCIDSVCLQWVESDTSASIIKIHFKAYDDTTETNYVFRQGPLTPHDLCNGFLVGLYDSSETHFFYEVEIGYDCYDTLETYITERTFDDTFTMATVRGDLVKEMIIQNEDTLRFFYEPYLFDGMRGDTAGRGGCGNSDNCLRWN